VELWELNARESIRDLVARYNANGDSGRFEEMLKVFADDAVMELVSFDGSIRRYEGIAQVATIFSDTKASWDRSVRPTATRHHVRHFTATHQIDLVDESHARGRCYFLVLMGHGVDHWGRYIDEYGVRNDRWVITQRRALSDGSIDDSTGAKNSVADD
jgi:hypothetical protein